MASDEYFQGYEDLKVHYTMLTDKIRVEAYRKAIEEQKSLFEGKTVLDVGSGTGILSVFCAKAGAAKVYAVEASGVANLCSSIVQENELSHIIQVIHKPVEEVKLTEKVDILVSEWMGFFLLHESMLPSIIWARDNLLKSDGLIFPDHFAMYSALFYLPELEEPWTDFEGVRMSSFASSLLQSRPPFEIKAITEENLVSDSAKVLEIDLYKLEKCDMFESTVLNVVTKESVSHGIAIWFKATFPGGMCLDTSPDQPETHWKQTICNLPRNEFPEGYPLAYTMQFNSTLRTYSLTLTVIDPNTIQHPMMCNCFGPICKIKRAFMNGEPR